MNFRGLRLHTAFSVAGILTAIFIVLAIGFYGNRSHNLHRDMDVALKARADWIEGLAREPAEAGSFSSFQEEMEEHTDLGREGRVVQILSESGTILFRSKNLGTASLPFLSEELTGLRACQWKNQTIDLTDQGRFRLITQNGKEEKGRGPGFFVQIAMPLGDMEKNLSRLVWTLGASISLAGLLFAIGIWFLVGRALKPVAAIVRATNQIKADNLEKRLDIPKTGDEIEQLALTLNAMLKKLELSFQQMRQFIADASHEIRTPLGILMGETDVALRTAHSPQEYRQALENNREEMTRLACLVERLLLLSHMETGQWRWQKQSINLKELACELAEKTQLLGSEKNLRVALKADEEFIIEGDAMRLRQLLLNLADNAVKNSHPQGRILLALLRENGHVKISVQDEGVGISPEHIPKIFDRFYRVDKARERERGGYGLGLAIAQTIAQAHQGKIEVQSEVGRGSLFTVKLPLAATHRQN